MSKEKKIKRAQTIGEEIANSISHGVMALFAIFALIMMIIKSQNGWQLAASIVFGLSMFLLYISSTLYHALSFTKAKGLFKRFDHISIYMLIGGTFAPIFLLLPSFQEPLFGIENFISIGLSLFIGQWLLILLGIILKSIWVYKFQTMHVIIFLLIGWSGLYFMYDLYHFSMASMWLILLGGLSYSLGVIFYKKSNKEYFHFIWHIFVGMGTILQFLAIYNYFIV
ncbi:PAQR family membrane homeostasis protein TrhA [Acholeplasma granularum]|uniref:PAQR family membrane homeostasis protein TrhA n=1 Tax=Acholeplasma granularum TaxID=264635 RepID=UPI0004712B42|nr:hemolysin III family protein [Acholeplasma granularum]